MESFHTPTKRYHSPERLGDTVKIAQNEYESSSSTKNKRAKLSSSLSNEEDVLPMDAESQTRRESNNNNRASFDNESCSGKETEVEEDEVSKKFRLFKKFDTICDFSDHYFATTTSSNSRQVSRNWAKAIQHEWKILEKDLPDTIFVRVYEERMDLLRTVIVGAAGTPYHDGLFFFDFYFPHTYPSEPPQVYYHSGGLDLNPNLYSCGKVCLSLLNTWMGDENELWVPGKSTVLQVLLSIQALVLNAKPYFNEPGYEIYAGLPEGESAAEEYNENIYILSCRTMLFTLRNPPKHFEDFVVGHFRERAHAILVACKAYMEGARVGYLVEGGVQNVDEGDKSSSENFQMQVAEMVKCLVPAFSENGAKYCEQFLPKINNNENQATNVNEHQSIGNSGYQGPYDIGYQAPVNSGGYEGISNGYQAPYNNWYQWPLSNGYQAPFYSGYQGPYNIGYQAPSNSVSQGPYNIVYHTLFNNGYQGPYNNGYQAPYNNWYQWPYNYVYHVPFYSGYPGYNIGYQVSFNSGHEAPQVTTHNGYQANSHNGSGATSAPQAYNPNGSDHE